LTGRTAVPLLVVLVVEVPRFFEFLFEGMGPSRPGLFREGRIIGVTMQGKTSVFLLTVLHFFFFKR